MNTDYYPAPDELRDAYINENTSFPNPFTEEIDPESLDYSRGVKIIEQDGKLHFVPILPKSFDLDAEIDRQRKLGYETFDDYVTRTGFPADEHTYTAWLGEGRWMITSRDAQ